MVAVPLHAQPRSAVVTAVDTPIALDGALDEPIWSRAPGIGSLVQRQPRQGAEPSERTDVTLLYSDTHLYIGIPAHDAEPARVIGTQMARDGSIASDDRVEIILDTFRDQCSAFYFATNPSGALVDGLVANGQLNADWDAIWDVRTRRTDEGWIAEFAIPFKSLGFPAGARTWGFNVTRTIHRKLEEVRWSGARLERTSGCSPFARAISTSITLRSSIPEHSSSVASNAICSSSHTSAPSSPTVIPNAIDRSDLRRGFAARDVAAHGQAAKSGVQRLRGPLREHRRLG